MVNIYHRKLYQKNLHFFEISFLYNGVLCSKWFKLINNLLSFFWWNVNFFCSFCFFLFLWFAYWSNVISYFISNQISCSFCSFVNYLFTNSFCSIYFCCGAVSINFLPSLTPSSLANDKKPYPLKYFLNFGSAEYLTFIMSAQ